MAHHHPESVRVLCVAFVVQRRVRGKERGASMSMRHLEARRKMVGPHSSTWLFQWDYPCYKMGLFFILESGKIAIPVCGGINKRNLRRLRNSLIQERELF